MIDAHRPGILTVVISLSKLNYRSAPITLVYYRRYPTVVVSDNTILCKIACYPMRSCFVTYRFLRQTSIIPIFIPNRDSSPSPLTSNDVSKLDTRIPSNINRAIFQNTYNSAFDGNVLCWIDIAQQYLLSKIVPFRPLSASFSNCIESPSLTLIDSFRFHSSCNFNVSYLLFQLTRFIFPCPLLKSKRIIFYKFPCMINVENNRFEGRHVPLQSS